MKRLLLCLPLLLLVACNEPAEKQARDVIAAANGAITAAQSVCAANPQARACPFIPQAVASENAAITALETYCGFTPSMSREATCKPIKSYETALITALGNLNQFTTEIKGALQ